MAYGVVALLLVAVPGAAAEPPALQRQQRITVPAARAQGPGVAAEAPATPAAAAELLRQAAADALQTVLGVPAGEVLTQRRRQQALEAQQAELVRQQARQFEQLLQPLLRAELELVRSTCGDLPVATRRDVLAAGRAAVTVLATEAVARQLQGGTPLAEADPRTRLHREIAAALAPHVDAAVLAAYDREDEQRVERRARVARERIVAKLDEQLELSAAQRAAILEDLRSGWEASWARELDDRGGLVVNNHRPAPDYAEARITPHLDDAQRATWKAWCRAAGSRMLGQRARWHFDGPGLPPDPWWENP
jgi:hypothetical protein